MVSKHVTDEWEDGVSGVPVLPKTFFPYQVSLINTSKLLSSSMLFRSEERRSLRNVFEHCGLAVFHSHLMYKHSCLGLGREFSATWSEACCTNGLKL